MIQLLKTIDGQRARIVKEYPNSYEMQDAMELFTKNYRNELNEKDNTMYLESLESELSLLNEGVTEPEILESNKQYIENIDYKGSGYYSVYGDCLLLDDELKSVIREDNITWELVEVPNTIIISRSELNQLLTNSLENEFLSIRNDGSVCLVSISQRTIPDNEVLRIRLTNNLEEHNAYLEENLEQDGNYADEFADAVESEIYDKAKEESISLDIQ